MNNFTIDYDNRVLTLHYCGQVFMWGLLDDQSDPSDVWMSFVTKDKGTFDVNFYQEYDYENNTPFEEPTLSVYPVIENEDGELEISTSNYELIPLKEKIGESQNYFNIKTL